MSTETIQRRLGTRERAYRALGTALPAGKMAHRDFPLSFPVPGMAPGTFFLPFPVPGMAERTGFLPFPGAGTWRGRIAGRFRGAGMRVEKGGSRFPGAGMGGRDGCRGTRWVPAVFGKVRRKQAASPTDRRGAAQPLFVTQEKNAEPKKKQTYGRPGNARRDSDG